MAPSAIDQIRPCFVSEYSFVDDGGPADSPAAWQPGARRYRVGSANMPGLTALAASLALIEEVGLAAIDAQLA